MDKRFFFFFNDTATTEIYTLSLHDALPISQPAGRRLAPGALRGQIAMAGEATSPEGRVRCRTSSRSRWLTPPKPARDRKSTRLNSSHANISYAVFCLKKKKIVYV